MKERTCVHCGATVVMPNDGAETVIRGETPSEHLDRTGHNHFHEPIMTECRHCEHVWLYEGDRESAACPNCQNPTPVGIPQ